MDIERKGNERKMGRGKIVMKRIENMSSRLVTFSKRKDGLLKKANELAVLCGAIVAVIVFSDDGKRYEYSSSRMESILDMYNEVPKSDEQAVADTVASEEPQTEEDALRAEISALRRMQSELLAKDLQELSITDLQQLEHTFNEGLLSIKNHMGRKLMGQLELSQQKEEKARIEAKMLREEIEQLQNELARKENSAGEADTSLNLGLSADTSLKLKNPKAKNDAEKPMSID